MIANKLKYIQISFLNLKFENTGTLLLSQSLLLQCDTEGMTRWPFHCVTTVYMAFLLDTRQRLPLSFRITFLY